jgi:hypothetical protein
MATRENKFMSAGSRYPERRTVARFAFSAEAEIHEPVERRSVSGLVTTISKKGCFVKVQKPFDGGTVMKVRIQNGDTSFETWARVADQRSSLADGMALVFFGTAPEQAQVLESWLGSLAPTRC